MDVEERYRPAIEARLEPGERVEGICVVTRERLFKGGALVVGVTDRRLILQPLGWRGEVKGEPSSIAPGELAAADAGGVSGGWPSVAAPISDQLALKVKLRTTGGERLKLNMMRGGSRLGGGEAQARGVAALGAWLERAGALR